MDADVIIIGSGHNGLVCGGYLAKWGYKVLVLERRDTIGGAVCTEEMFGGFQLDVGGSAHFMIHHTPIVQDLELAKYGLEYIPLDPFMVAPFDDGEAIAFYKDLDATCQSIAKISEQDADLYRAFIQRWQPINEAVFESFLKPPTGLNLLKSFAGKKLHANSQERDDMIKDLLTSYGRLLDKSFTNPKMKAALAWWGAQSGPPPIDAASAEFIGWHSVIHKHGPARPKGGSGMLTQALKRQIEDHGGRVLNNSEVKKILVKDNTAQGVELHNGTTYTAKRIVSNAHLWVTFRQLLSDWTPPALRKRIDSVHVGNGFGLVLRCAMDGLPKYNQTNISNEEAWKGLQLLCPTTQYLNDAYADYVKGLPSEDPAAVVMTFSAIDPTLAPAGKHTMFVWGQYYPYHLRNNQNWDDIQQREYEKLLNVVERFAPGTKEMVRDTYIQTPKVISEKHNMPNANVMHVEMVIDQMFMNRPLPEFSGYAAGPKGLFLASAGMHPGGGIFGAPGYNCAHVVKKSFRPRLFGGL